MEKMPKIESKENFYVKHLGSEELKNIMNDYEKDPDNFYQINEFEFIGKNGRNPHIIAITDFMVRMIEDTYGNNDKINMRETVKDARNIAMIIIKYLGGDIEDFCKVEKNTVFSVLDEMKDGNSFKKSCAFILEDIKKNDPEFASFLATMSVRNLKTGEMRNDEEMGVIVEVASSVAKVMYEQMKKDAKYNKNNES
jgi:hypothetical protein